MVIHELIHGLFFKLFAANRPVQFGFNAKTMMAFVTSPGSLYSRCQFLVITLSPFVVLTTVLTLFLAAGWLSPLAYVGVATCHAAGCVGDFDSAYLLLFPYRYGDVRVEDTETGIKIFQV